MVSTFATEACRDRSKLRFGWEHPRFMADIKICKSNREGDPPGLSKTSAWFEVRISLSFEKARPDPR